MKVVLDPGAKLPTKAHTADAGFDLYAPENMSAINLYSHDSAIIDTGVHMAIPSGYCGLIVAKSGLNMKQGITVTGLVDSEFSGSIRVKLYRDDNYADHYTIEPGDKIAQIMILPVPQFELEIVDTLDETERGSNGFGSTGR